MRRSGGQFYPVPHRHYLFSIPIILRQYFLYNRKLLSELCRLAHMSLLEFFRTTLGRPDGVLATIMGIQTIGDYAKWHPHSLPHRRWPLCRAWGLLLHASLPASSLGRTVQGQCAQDARSEIGFSFHNGVRLARGDQRPDRRGPVHSPPRSQGRTTFNDSTATVIDKSKMTYGKAEGGKMNLFRL